MLTDRSLEHLQPIFRAKVAPWLNDLLAESRSDHGPLAGVEFYVTETFRPWERQAALYALGRNSAGVIIHPEQVVTKAPPGASAHQYGLALDGGPKYVDQPFSWDWDADPRLMRAVHRMADLAHLHAMVWGGNFESIRDLPHWQDASFKKDVARATWPHGWHY